MSRRVVITGIGPVTSVGVGREAFYQGVWARRINAAKIPEAFRAHHAFHSQWYVPLPAVSLADQGIHLTHDSLMQPEDRMAVLGARIAFEDAGFALSDQADRLRVAGAGEVGVILGTGLGGLQTAFESYVSHALSPALRAAAFPGERLSYSRVVIPKTMPNSPAAWVSICFGSHGPCHTVNASCASGTCAIGEAFRHVRDGYHDVMLTGGVECLQDQHGAILRGFDALGVLTRSEDGAPGPFSRDRSGFLFAEGGACLLVLEELEHARRRGASIYAEIVDYHANSDAYSILQIDPEGRQIRRLLVQIASSRRVDYLNTHGTGTVANDEVEACAIRAVFGDRGTQPLINSTKGILGHTLGASGAIEAAVAALAIARGTVHGNLIREPMENLNLPLESVAARIDCALSVSYGFGGHNAALRLQRCEVDG